MRGVLTWSLLFLKTSVQKLETSAEECLMMSLSKIVQAFMWFWWLKKRAAPGGAREQRRTETDIVLGDASV